MSGGKYIGEIVFNQNIDKYSKSKKDSLKREIYDKMVGWCQDDPNLAPADRPRAWPRAWQAPIKLKGDKAFVYFNDTYKNRNKDKSMYNLAQKNFKRSMNFNKKMFLDDSLKAVKVSVKKDNKTKKKHK